MKNHMIAFLLGVLLDWIIGDPMNLPHPIRWIGNMISKETEKLLNPFLENGRDASKEKIKGIQLVIYVLLVTVLASFLLLALCYRLHPILGIAIEAIMTCYLLAAKSLYAESMKVGKALLSEGLDAGRKTVSMIVGRDTEGLSEEGVIKAAVETVAENTSDGVIAPLLYTFIGGPVLAFVYKAINTMDSMVGYHNDKYENYGFAAAKLDDVVNYIPSRLSALVMIFAAFLCGPSFSGKDAWKVFIRDRYNHKSPNSAQTESVCAGALGLQLAGPASYFGKVVEKPYIGDKKRSIEIEDIKRANVLMFATELLTILICLCIAWAANRCF